ncbi:DUF262 domain-containing protein [Paraburkholderia nemoris]|uniref:DUF262 domain-containing protein n=1 Tax=Paraburkholderia nemoris TaxID=2793076 RepID=UPI0038B9E165
MENVFVVRPFSTTSIGWWYAERDQLDLSPPYQRKSGVWTQKDKAYLVDSIINGYDMPKFYIADFSYASGDLNTSGRPYAVIDGRQRFEAIFDFLDGRVPLNSDIRYLADNSIRLGGMTARDLEREHGRILKRIESFNLSVMSVITNQADRINDLFVRLNKSKPLTGAEVRSAMSGEIPTYIRTIAAHDFFARYVGFSNQRKQHENVAAKLLLIEHRGGFVETKKTNLDRFVAEALLTESEFSYTASTVQENLDQMSRVFGQGNALLRSSGMLPVYYWIVRNHIGVPQLGTLLKDFERFRADHVTHPAVVAFNAVSRSTNDELSYRVRYSVLSQFVEAGGVLDASDFVMPV